MCTAIAIAGALAGCFPQFGEYIDAGAGGQGTTEATGGATSSDPCAAAVQGAEDCLDGCDNDGDGDVDCADADCGDFVCMPAFPAGWDGPTILSDGGVEPPCPADYDGAVRNGDELLAVPAETCACTCGAALGGTCATSVTMEKFISADCTGASSNLSIPLTTLAAPMCNGAIGTLGSGRASLAATGGSCQGQSTPSDPGFSEQSRAFCTATRVGGGCTSGACVPRPKSGFESRVCAVEPGDVPCTSPDYAVRTVVYTDGITDERACPTCECGAPTGASCAGSISLFVNGGCGAAAGGVLLDGLCYPQQNGSLPATGGNFTVSGVDQGSCAPVDPAPAVTGDVVGSGPVTVCCSGVL